MTSRKTLTFFRCWAIATPTIYFSLVTDTMHMTILFSVICALVFLRNKAIEVTVRSTVYALVICLTSIVLLDAFIKIENRFYLTPSEMGIPTALIFAMALTFFDDRPTNSSIILILSIFAIMMCGDITNNHQVINLPLPQSFGELKVLQNIYIGALLFSIVPFFFLMNRSQNKLKISQLPTTLSWAFLKYIIIICALASSFLFYKPTIQSLVPLSRDFENKVIQWATQFRQNRNRSAFDEQINLKNSYLMNNLDLDTVLIRVQADNIPGYLRSRTYDYYHLGSWNSKQKPESMNLLTETHEYTHSTYSFNGQAQLDKKQLTKMDIFYSGSFRVNTLLHKGKSHYLEMKSEGLEQTEAGTVSGKGLDFSGGLTLYNPKNSSIEDAFQWPKLSDENTKPYLQIPTDELSAFLTSTFQHLQRKTTNETVQALIRYFPENNYVYSLTARLKRSMDPIEAFVDLKQGHCELYATTSVLALRSLGIPARYVTGFFCSEEHPSGSYYVGRSMDLHAWVEYYDASLEKWRLMEPTPPGEMPQGTKKFDSFSANWDNIKNRWQNFISSIVRGFFAESIIIFLKSLFDGFLWFFNSPLKALASVGILYFIIRRKKAKRGKENYDEDLRSIKKECDRMIKKISGLKEFQMTPSMTIQEIIDFLEKKDGETAQTYAHCLKEYESLRYNKKGRSHEKVHETRLKIIKSLKTGIR